MKLFIGNLSWDATDDSLRQLFEEHGTVVSVHIVQDPYTGRSKGFGFVEMGDAAAGNAAVNALNDKPYLGRPLRVSEARQENRREGGGGDRGPRGSGGGGRPPRDGNKPFRPRYEESQYS